jgi:deoxycytidylate deaminase
MYIYGFSVEDGSSVCGKPCLMCRRVIINAGIKEVIFLSSDGKSLKKQLVVGWVENSKERPEGDLEYGN